MKAAEKLGAARIDGSRSMAIVGDQLVVTFTLGAGCTPQVERFDLPTGVSGADVVGVGVGPSILLRNGEAHVWQYVPSGPSAPGSWWRAANVVAEAAPAPEATA